MNQCAIFVFPSPLAAAFSLTNVDICFKVYWFALGSGAHARNGTTKCQNGNCAKWEQTVFFLMFGTFFFIEGALLSRRSWKRGLQVLKLSIPIYPNMLYLALYTEKPSRTNHEYCYRLKLIVLESKTILRWWFEKRTLWTTDSHQIHQQLVWDRLLSLSFGSLGTYLQFYRLATQLNPDRGNVYSSESWIMYWNQTHSL